VINLGISQIHRATGQETRADVAKPKCARLCLCVFVTYLDGFSQYTDWYESESIVNDRNMNRIRQELAAVDEWVGSYSYNSTFKFRVDY
jgi:hypothetical protein